MRSQLRRSNHRRSFRGGTHAIQTDGETTHTHTLTNNNIII